MGDGDPQRARGGAGEVGEEHRAWEWGVLRGCESVVYKKRTPFLFLQVFFSASWVEVVVSMAAWQGVLSLVLVWWFGGCRGSEARLPFLSWAENGKGSWAHRVPSSLSQPLLLEPSPLQVLPSLRQKFGVTPDIAFSLSSTSTLSQSLVAATF